MATQEIPKLTFTVCDDEDENLQVSGSDTDDSSADDQEKVLTIFFHNIFAPYSNYRAFQISLTNCFGLIAFMGRNLNR